MLKVVGALSLEALMDEAVPACIRLKKPLDLSDGQSEEEYLRELRLLAARNQIFKSYIGLGYHDCVTPSVILRNVLRESGLVYALHPVSTRDCARPPRRAPQFPDHGSRSHGNGDRERVALGRSHRRGGSHDDAPPRMGEADRFGRQSGPVLRRRLVLPADD